MVDKVKPLKIESGNDTDFLPTEANPVEDYVSTKGIAFENLDEFLIEKRGRVLVELFPNLYQSVTYTNDTVSYIEFYNSNTFITANRVARIDCTYTGDNLTSEALKIYDSDGTTVLRSYTWTHVYTSNIFQNTGLLIT
jgi:hypothetical protein